MFNKHDLKRDEFMLTGSLADNGYDWWWHSFTARNAETGEERPFFIEFFACNPALGGMDPVLGQLPENREAGRKPSYLMVKVGTWGKDHAQLHRFFGWGEVEMRYKEPFHVGVGDCFVSDRETYGSVSLTEEESKAHPEYMCDWGEITWKLKIYKDTAFNVGYGASTPLRAAKAFEMYWHAEGMKTLYEGEITYNGVKYIVDPVNCYGYADKNWGKGFTSPWVWLSSNNLTSNLTGKQLKDSVFDIGGGKPKIYFVPLDRKLLSAFWYEGEPFEFNFSKFWTLTRTKFDFKETDDEVFWHVWQENTKAAMDVNLHCRKEDMLLINYEEPDGRKRHNRLWNGGNGEGDIKLYRKVKGGLHLIDDIHAKNIGCEYGEFDKE